MKRVAAIQMASGPNVGSNLTEAGRLIGRAADAGAGMVVLPENFAIMGLHETDKIKVREKNGSGHIQDFLAEQANRHGIWIVGGTVPIEAGDDAHVWAACQLYDDSGKIVTRYDKVHLFDVHLSEANETYNESATVEPGSSIVVSDTPFGKLGLAICYDLRFPELFRSMSDAGVEIIAIPSAFTAITGKAHWETLLRARAIENLSYVVASAQGGFHVNGRETYGHSMIVDPWGAILDELPRGSGFVIADIDLQKVKDTRRSFPVLEHRKMPCSIPHV
ncbi:MAG: carbon-nitrogen hydrolase family protein [Gammaproteobacteria bacterium]|nr:carbon-nitrogen hydrolase family protein [Gammaproteobacteria bacterium]MDH5653665.1 carbon-nitrogen hydrolase family protein [Gammaproteobacteria bacterium]